MSKPKLDDDPPKQPDTRDVDPHYWIRLVRDTRNYGVCYVHASVRKSPNLQRGRITINGITFSWCFFGRSKSKCKAYAHYADTGKVVVYDKLLNHFCTIQ